MACGDNDDDWCAVTFSSGWEAGWRLVDRRGDMRRREWAKREQGQRAVQRPALV